MIRNLEVFDGIKCYGKCFSIGFAEVKEGLDEIRVRTAVGMNGQVFITEESDVKLQDDDVPLSKAQTLNRILRSTHLTKDGQKVSPVVLTEVFLEFLEYHRAELQAMLSLFSVLLLQLLHLILKETYLKLDHLSLVLVELYLMRYRDFEAYSVRKDQRRKLLAQKLTDQLVKDSWQL